MSSAAFLYESGALYDPNTFIPSTSGWHLFIASGINDRGLIVGTETVNGAFYAFLLTPSVAPPDVSEPGALATTGAFALGLSATLVRGRRRERRR